MTTQTDRINGVLGDLGVKTPCRAATAGITLTLSGLQTVDGVVLVAGDRVLVKDQTDSTQNGIYVADTVAWTRAPDFDGVRDVASGTLVTISEGTTNAGTAWRVTTTGAITPGTTAITFASALQTLSATQAAASATAAAASAASASASAAVVGTWSYKGSWVTATSYAVNNIVVQSGTSYLCLVAHTSGTFSTDYSAGNWGILAQQGAAGAGTGDMLKANNLSELPSMPTALTNLGALPKAGGSMAGGFNEARGSIAMNATTMDIFAGPNIQDGTGSAVTITAIVNAPQAGARRVLYPITGTKITNGATFAVDGAADYTTAVGDALEFEAITTSTYKVHITKKDGTAVVGGVNQYVKCEDQKASGTGGGAAISGWQTRVLNTKVNDINNIATLAANQVTLPAGTYRVRAKAPSYSTYNHACRLRNITDSTTTVVGISGYSNSNYFDQDYSMLEGEFIIAASKTFELQQYCAGAQASNGLGIPVSSGEVEVYAQIEFTKVA